jgi:hypothetical protein
MARGTCFVIMPFRPELHYMYLYVKQHLRDVYDLDCERGDSSILTVPLLEKIQRYIENADAVIADCSGRNANVFYELGMAHVLGKPVILITSEPIDKAPTDIKSFEFIRYSLDDHESFLNKLGLALQGVFGEGLDDLYEAVVILFESFCHDMGLRPPQNNREEFIRCAASRSRAAALPAPDDLPRVAQYLPDLVAAPIDIEVVLKLREWIQGHHPG